MKELNHFVFSFARAWWSTGNCVDKSPASLAKSRSWWMLPFCGYSVPALPFDQLSTLNSINPTFSSDTAWHFGCSYCAPCAIDEKWDTHESVPRSALGSLSQSLLSPPARSLAGRSPVELSCGAQAGCRNDDLKINRWTNPAPDRSAAEDGKQLKDEQQPVVKGDFAVWPSSQALRDSASRRCYERYSGRSDRSDGARYQLEGRVSEPAERCGSRPKDWFCPHIAGADHLPARRAGRVQGNCCASRTRF